MSKGGARNRSGPGLDPKSLRSSERGVVLTALPSAGYQGEVPLMPLGRSTTDDLTAEREGAIWAEAWTTPQACAWALEPWRWPIIAEYCRLKAIVELSPAATAALVAQLHRYRDQIGLTPAGLKENGWAISADEVGAKREERQEQPPKRTSARDRMKVVSGGDGD